MLLSRTPTLLAFLVNLVTLCTAQVSPTTVPSCKAAQSELAFNSLGQSPCLVAAYLGTQCNANYKIEPVIAGSWYLRPTILTANACLCNGAYYSMLAACSLCQFGLFEPWSTWTVACPANDTSVGSFPPGIPDGTAIPHWAFVDVSKTNGFSLVAANEAGLFPESLAGGAASAAPPGQSATAVLFPSTAGGATATNAEPGLPANTNTNENPLARSGQGRCFGSLAWGTLFGALGLTFSLLKPLQNL
ncbi:hypothetical protein BD410DRAFT_824419 [Rickenella mellea]|uniref:Uncharacterized protein n=1 Tax=Rickenella mellea TaxID=50990 RepID=A0A4Y7QME0_9AGAM|nr:hypothetical protein BD410DRAFT_824419 [Rickenella mellea]